MNTGKRTGICSICGEVKLIRRKRKQGIRWFCAIKDAEWRGKEDNLKDPILGKIPVPPGTREHLLKLQKRKCAICGVSLDATVKALDHCHASGIIRGYLCRNCNLGIAYFFDTPKFMRAAAKYIEKYKGKE